tara:strand:- start:305 stop:553 length:249 start_codon:yes stop_codon:yes gene_type:complete
MFWRKKDLTDEQHTLWFIDEVQKRLGVCRNKKEKDIVINIILDRLGHKHKVTGSFKVMDKMRDYKEDDIASTKKMRKLMELE